MSGFCILYSVDQLICCTAFSKETLSLGPSLQTTTVLVDGDVCCICMLI